MDKNCDLYKLLTDNGFRTEIMSEKVKPDAREDWVQKRLSEGMQVLITNPSLVETGLDLNAFTTLIFYSMGYKLFTLRQASRRSWRINHSLMPRRNGEDALSGAAQKFNRNILEHVMGSEDYPTIKNICEGRELPAQSISPAPAASGRTFFVRACTVPKIKWTQQSVFWAAERILRRR